MWFLLGTEEIFNIIIKESKSKENRTIPVDFTKLTKKKKKTQPIITYSLDVRVVQTVNEKDRLSDELILAQRPPPQSHVPFPFRIHTGLSFSTL